MLLCASGAFTWVQAHVGHFEIKARNLSAVPFKTKHLTWHGILNLLKVKNNLLYKYIYFQRNVTTRGRFILLFLIFCVTSTFKNQ